MPRIYRISDPLLIVLADFPAPLVRLSSALYITKLAFTASD